MKNNKINKEKLEYIFDVGANEGIIGLGLAINNRDKFVHAFEPNPILVRTIKKLKKKIENKKGMIINNYKIHNCAVGEKNKFSEFYISKNHRVSSLYKLSRTLEDSWPGYKEHHFKVIKKIRTKVIKLKDFIINNNIKSIRYIKIDTQGNDLKVLRGMEEKIDLVTEGKLEIAISKEKSAYKNVDTLKNLLEFLSKSPLKILKINKIEHLSKNKIIKNEADIYFKNRKNKRLSKFNLNFNGRYFLRLLNNNSSIKDNLFDLFLKYINYFKSI